MLAFYLPAFVANTTLSANIGINRANYMDLIFLAIASVVVIPQLALLGAACFSAPRSRPAQSNTKSRSAED